MPRSANPAPILEQIRADDLAHDPWGTGFAWHFAIAECLTEWAPPYPPHHWGYNAPLGPDTDDYRYQELTAMLEEGTIDTQDLYYVGEILHRHAALCRLAGRDY